MKRYIVPTLHYAELRLEERIASNCTGSCTEEDFNKYPDLLKGLVALNGGS